MYNFGQIKETYNKIYLESFTKKDSKKKKVFEYYINKLKKSPILKEEFECYTSLKNTNFSNELDSLIFIEENINIIKRFNQKELSSLHKDLVDHLVKNKYKLVESTDEKIVLFESLLNTEKNSKNLSKITESITKLRNALVKEVSEEKDVNESVSLPTNVLSNLLTNKFNSKYGDLDETTKNLIKVSLKGSEKEKTELFDSTLKECIELVNVKLKESISDLELKEKLLQTKERLLEMSFNEEKYIEDLTKLVDLKTNL
jgi:hypothetical protein